MSEKRAPRPDAAQVRPPLAFGEELQKKYQALCEKYDALVRRLESRQLEQTSVFTLGWWAMRASASGLALLRDGKIVVSNALWNELASSLGGGPGWRAPEEDQGGVAPRSLRQAALDEAALLFSEGGPPVRVRRYQQVNGRAVIEMRCERTVLPGNALSTLVMVHDVTKEVRAESELKEAQQALAAQERLRIIGELASGVAHDLNNTLNAVALRLQVIAGEPGFRDKQAANFAALERIVGDAVTMVGRLQDFARTRRDRPEAQVDIRSVIAEAVETARPEIEGTSQLGGAQVQIEVALEELPGVSGDAMELRQVFVNLMLNARDAMPRGGRIHIGGARRGGRVAISVADEGTGIAVENLERVFDPFFTTKGPRGTGLGLSMAANVIARLGGAVSAANRVGGGAVITIDLPVAGAATAVAEAVDEEAPIAGPVPAARILLVDDDLDNLEATRDVMALEGQRVEIAASGREALDRIRADRHFDMVLCDVGMPEMNGWDVARQIHEIEPELRVYLLTGWANQIGPDDPRLATVRGILAKPLDLKKLRRLLSAPAA